MKSYLIVICLMAVIASNAAAQPTPQRITKVVKPQRLVSNKVVRSVSSPRWNLSGSWSRVRDRNDLINHLATTHKYSRATLSQMTIQMLWALHDDDHEGRATLSKANAIKTEEYCPPGGT
jgi:hypothetical protein